MSEPPKSPKDARRQERVKHGSRAVRDVRPRDRGRFGQTTKPRPARPPPVLGSIGETRGTSDEPTVVLSRRAVARLDQGHDWIHRTGLASTKTNTREAAVRTDDQSG